MFNLLFVLISISRASTEGQVSDESCLLQTSSSVHRHSGVEERTRGGGELGSAAYLAVEQKNARPVPTFEINLDDPPADRFTHVARRFKKQYYKFYNEFGNSTGALNMALGSSLMRGPEDPELQAEAEGVAKALGIPAYYIQQQQLAFPLQEMKGPFFTYLHKMNMSIPSDETMLKTVASPQFLKMFPAFGCTGIIARDDNDGTIWHARNLDIGFQHWIQNLTYNAVFKKGGKEIFTGQMIFPLQQVGTGMRRGPNGYAYEFNARYGDTAMDSKSLMLNLYKEKRKPGGWIARKILENNDNYEDAVKAFSDTPLPGKEYAILSGANDGVILARNADSVAYKMDLGKNRYILMTNFDYLYNDPKENIMWEKEVSRREKAQRILNASKVITPALLQQVITDDQVQIGATIFQAMMSVKHGVYNSTLPRCPGCDCEADCDASEEGDEDSM
jgi:hypothetical protein